MSRHTKTIIILVEGHSDIEALRNIISKLFDDYYNGLFNVEFIKENEDITAFRGMQPRVIEEWSCRNYINPFLKKNFLEWGDIHHIIQITDLDGSFINDDLVTENPSISSTVYCDSGITTRCKKDILQRNRRKKTNLEYLSSITHFHIPIVLSNTPIPYQIFYFASNLDHFLHGEANLDDCKKVLFATQFSRRVSPNKFEESLLEGGSFFPYVIKNCSYEDSWKYISQGTRSLERFTNINLLIEEIQNGYFTAD